MWISATLSSYFHSIGPVYEYERVPLQSTINCTSHIPETKLKTGTTGIYGEVQTIPRTNH